MKHWKIWQISLFTVFCVLLNVGGKLLASFYELPLWLDSFGTVLCAYLMGPVCGSMVGVTGNILFSISTPIAWIYGLTSIALALIVGLGIRHRTLDSLLGAMTVAMLAAIAAALISSVLNLLFTKGLTGNRFGDAVIGFLGARNVPWLFRAFIGQFYVDFLDKLVTVFALYGMILAMKAHGRNPALHWSRSGQDALSLLLVLGLVFGVGGTEACAARDGYDSYVQTVYDSGRGLPCGEANDIAQTTDGILWIGTYAGLYRYNGSEFRHWIDESETVRNANCLYVDEEGRLWIGTNDSGLAIVINEQLVNVIDRDSGLPTNSVRAIVCGADGYYYIGTTSSLQILTLNDGLRNVGALQEMNDTRRLAADSQGNVAAVTKDGRLFLLRRGEILSSLRLTTEGDQFRCCGFDRLGRLVVGSRSNRLRFYDVSGGDFALLREIRCDGLSGLNDLYFPGNGEMFISADNGVALLDNQGSYRHINTNEFNNSIDNMLMDYQGNLWFTSSRLGLLRLAPSSFRDIYSVLGMENKVVNTVAQWQGKLYFGTDKGLDSCNLACTTQLQDDLTERLKDVRIRCMLTDSKGTLWICTYGQGVIAAGTDGDIRVYDSEDGIGKNTRMVTELSDGSIAVGTDTGISILRDGVLEKHIGHAEGLVNEVILTITELNDGSLLAGTDGDGIALVRDGEVRRTLTKHDGLSSEVILRSVADPKGEGTFLVTSNGLCFMNPDCSVRQLRRFPYYNNYDIWARDENTLFIMSSAGIYVTRRDELLAPEARDGDDTGFSCELLDSKRGLNSSLTANSWSVCDEEGTLYLPCGNGVFSINPWDYDSKLRTYRLSVPTVRLNGKEYHRAQGEAIEVGEGINRIELVPEIVNFSVQVPPVGYYLEGFDRDWTVTSQNNLNSIVYTNLPAGDYSLHLAVFNNERSSILAERQFALTKSESFYETVGFRLYFFGVILLAAVFLSSLFGYQRYSKMRKSAEMSNQAIITIAKAVDAKDLRTSQHSERVSQYSVMIARELGWSEKKCEDLRKAAKMHDIGKIGIPDSILNKPARLTDEEYAVMKSHTSKGGEILKGVTLIPHVSEGANYHHERYDGRGYPNGLKGKDIPEIARIIGVADAFDAMTANRIYRKQMDFSYVLEEMRKGRGTQFDPEADDALLRLIESGKIDLYNLYGVTPEEAEKLEKAAEKKNLSPEEAARLEAASRAVAEQEAADQAASSKPASVAAKTETPGVQKSDPGKEAQA